KVRSRLDRFNERAGAGKLPADVIEEGRTFLGRMPRLDAQQQLRRHYQQLADGNLSPADFLKKRDEIRSQVQLKRSETLAFAAKVMHGVNLLKEQHLQELGAGDLVATAIRGLYRQLDERPTTDLRERLDRCTKLDSNQLLNLLADIRAHLGKRED